MLNQNSEEIDGKKFASYRLDNFVRKYIENTDFMDFSYVYFFYYFLFFHIIKMSRSDYKNLYEGYLDNTKQYILEKYSIDELEYVSTKLSENNDFFYNNIIKPRSNSTTPRKICGQKDNLEVTTNSNTSCTFSMNQIDPFTQKKIETPYFKDGNTEYEVYVNTDQDGQTLKKITRNNGIMPISDCFNHMKNYNNKDPKYGRKATDPDAAGIVYYNKNINNEKQGTCWLIKKKIKETGNSSQSYERQGSIVVAKSLGFY